MTARLEISVVVSTYERPRHLERCLASLAAQRDVDGQFEIIVVDDGSQDDTAGVVERFRRESGLPVTFITHRHEGFQLARCRNSGIRAASSPYILFTDGDCIFPVDHLARHLAFRRPGVVAAGDCIRLDESTSGRIDLAAVRRADWEPLVPAEGRRWVRKLHRRGLMYQLVRHPQKPKLVGNNMGVWRDALLAINGFDERYRGWGCEDDDLRERLVASGGRVKTILGATYGYHLWHPPHATAPERWSEGVNIAYFHRPVMLSRCLSGIDARPFGEMTVRVQAGPTHGKLAEQVSRLFTGAAAKPDLEIVFWPSDARFGRDADARILAIDAAGHPPLSLSRKASALLPLGEQPTAGHVVADVEQLLGLTIPCGKFGLDSRAA